MDQLFRTWKISTCLPVVAGSILTRVLIDGGSGLNLIFMSTITKMGLDISDKLKPSKAPFYGIVPGNASFPIGTVVLPVTFGTSVNYRMELVKFEVADFSLLTMPYSDDQHWPNSWQFPTTSSFC